MSRPWFVVSFACWISLGLVSGLCGRVAPPPLEEPLPPAAVARLGTFRLYHAGQSFSLLAFSQDDRVLYSLVPGTPLRAWDVTTGRELPSPDRACPNLTAASVSPDCTLLAVGDEHDEVRIWNLKTGKLEDHYSVARSGCRHLGFAGESKLVRLDTDDTLHVRELRTRKETTLPRPQPGTVLNIADFVVSPDGHYLASRVGNGYRWVLLWDLHTGKRVRQYPDFEPQAMVYSICFAGDSRSLVGVWSNNVAMHWGVDGIEEKARMEINDLERGTACLSWDSKVLAVAISPGGVALYQIGSAKIWRTLPAENNSISLMSFSRSGRILAAGHDSGRIRLWDIDQKKLLHSEGAHDSFVDIRFTGEGDNLVGITSRHILHLAARTGQVTRSVELTDLSSTSAVLSPSGKRLAVNLPDTPVRIHDTHQATGPVDLPLKLEYPAVLTFSPDSNTLAATDFRFPNVARLFDASTGKQRQMLKLDAHMLDRLALFYSADGRTLYTGHALDRHVQRWEVLTGTRRTPIRLPLAAMNDYRLQMWIQGRMQPTTQWQGERGAGLRNRDQFQVVCSPDGELLALPVLERVILCQARTGLGARHLEGALDNIEMPAFSPDGKWIAAGCIDHTVLLWEVRTGTLCARLTGHRGPVKLCRFSPDGRFLLTTANDTTGLVWNLSEVLKQPRPAPAMLPRNADLEKCWAGLASEEGLTVEVAMHALTANPAEAVRYLSRHLRPVAAATPARIDALIGDLDSDDRGMRELAFQHLSAIADQAEPALRKALKVGTPEVRKQATRLLERVESGTCQAQDARPFRAVEVLERIGNAPARKILADLSAGAAGARLTRDAAGALERLRRKISPEP